MSSTKLPLPAPSANYYRNPRSFLEDLGPPISRYPYDGIQQVWSIWETELHRQQANVQDSEWVLFTGVDEESFTRDFLNSPVKTISGSWNSYDKTSRLLLTRMPSSQAHEIAAHTFEHLLLKALEPMALDTKIKCMGSATCHGDGGSKRPDTQYQPKRLPRGRTTADWPTVVLEVAVSEPASKLMSDVRYWLRQSDGAVQVVLTLRVDRRIPEVTLEKWERNEDHDNRRPHREQSITIRKRATEVIEFRGDPLVIAFEKLFLRQPSAPREEDVRLGEEELRYLANSIWGVQGFHVDEDEA
ncbi:hypothetical protein PHISP_01052 [Aspergillus sp. HF37]|nr:hypothetical protein PHISP_01052 [Aspergillus sp. HF37]